MNRLLHVRQNNTFDKNTYDSIVTELPFSHLPCFHCTVSSSNEHRSLRQLNALMFDFFLSLFEDCSKKNEHNRNSVCKCQELLRQSVARHTRFENMRLHNSITASSYSFGCSQIVSFFLILKICIRVPDEITHKFYGCGNPTPLGIDGLHVLDLGSGSGRDCYVAAKLVGPLGFVTGVDMTDELVQVAAKHVDAYCLQTLHYPKSNMQFLKGYIEDLVGAGVQPNSIDMAISNCVVNLSPNKLQVLQSVYQVLKNGGEFYFSDVYCDRRLPEQAKKS